MTHNNPRLTLVVKDKRMSQLKINVQFVTKQADLQISNGL